MVALPAGTSLNSALAARHLTAADLKLRKTTQDGGGRRHQRYRQMLNGLDVVGGVLIVHVDGKGRVFAHQRHARGDIPAGLGSTTSAKARCTRGVADMRYAGMATTPPRKVYFCHPKALPLAYETVVTGSAGRTRSRQGLRRRRQRRHPGRPSADPLCREPPRLQRQQRHRPARHAQAQSRASAATSDIDVNAAYDGTGATFDAYKAFWNRDSYNKPAQHGQLRALRTNYCNAFWDGTQMVYGDGNGGQGCLPLARAQDVTAHELTHAVTENESGLIYSGESGGLNEAMSDIFGAFTERMSTAAGRASLAVRPTPGRSARTSCRPRCAI